MSEVQFFPDPRPVPTRNGMWWRKIDDGVVGPVRVDYSTFAAGLTWTYNGVTQAVTDDGLWVEPVVTPGERARVLDELAAVTKALHALARPAYSVGDEVELHTLDICCDVPALVRGLRGTDALLAEVREAVKAQAERAWPGAPIDFDRLVETIAALPVVEPAKATPTRVDVNASKVPVINLLGARRSYAPTFGPDESRVCDNGTAIANALSDAMSTYAIIALSAKCAAYEAAMKKIARAVASPGAEDMVEHITTADLPDLVEVVLGRLGADSDADGGAS